MVAVCSSLGRVHVSACLAACANVTVAREGECLASAPPAPAAAAAVPVTAATSQQQQGASTAAAAAATQQLAVVRSVSAAAPVDWRGSGGAQQGVVAVARQAPAYASAEVVAVEASSSHRYPPPHQSPGG